jgi:hypothetical protein
MSLPPVVCSLDAATRLEFEIFCGGAVIHQPTFKEMFLRRPQAKIPRRMVARITVEAPPMRVEICANGMSDMRLAADRIATSQILHQERLSEGVAHVM